MGGGTPPESRHAPHVSRNRPVDLQAHKKLADGGHGGPEEELEVLGGFRALLDSSLDGFLRDGAGVAEVDQGGEGVVASGAVVRATGCGGNGCSEVVELVLQFKDDALGRFLADAG